MTFTFVILHYKTANDTIECINSINSLENDGNVVNIVVVDNASNNGSIEEIEKLYHNQNNVIILKSNENIGFARGNNMGYSYARNVLKSDYIAVLNNDITIECTNLIQMVKKTFEEKQFAVMGPDIISVASGTHQNPACTTTSDKRKLWYEIIKYRILFILSKLGLYCAFQKKFGQGSSVDDNNFKESNNIGYMENCQLHGAFLVFSPIYLKNEVFAFYPETFLYCEEAILYRHCVRKGYLLIYNSAIKVNHKEDSSTEHINKTSKSKREFVFKNLIKSHKVYLRYLKDEERWN